MIDETYWKSFKNTETYGDNVVGAIGTPTVEMFVSSWNQKGEIYNTAEEVAYVELILGTGTTGYNINGGTAATISVDDQLFTPEAGYAFCKLASPWDGDAGNIPAVWSILSPRNTNG